MLKYKLKIERIFALVRSSLARENLGKDQYIFNERLIHRQTSHQQSTTGSVEMRQELYRVNYFFYPNEIYEQLLMTKKRIFDQRKKDRYQNQPAGSR